MDDDFMLTGLRAPRPELALRVRERLRQVDAERNSQVRRRILLRTAAQAAVLLLVVGMFAFPGVRAGAAAFLDLFRVVNFAAVPVQPDRLSTLLAQQGLDLPRMLGEQVTVLKAAGATRTVATGEEAGTLAGIRVLLPGWQPVGLEQQRIDVSTDRSWSITASAQKLQRLLDAFGINDLSVPDRIDGQTALIYVHPAVHVTYGGQAGHAVLVQSRQPEATLPAGVDLAQLAQIGLRVLGMERAEAARFAQSVDWRTTLLVPVPADASAFRQVNINGSAGLLIKVAPKGSGGAPRGQTWLLWSSGDVVFALFGDLRPEELFEMAQSL